MIEFALHYARNGYRVFPLVPDGKIPVISKERGGRGCHDGTYNVEQIERWWQEFPDANPAISTGNGLLVVDVDVKKSGKWRESLRELALPQTLTVRTATGGWHLYFWFRNDDRITIGADLLPGIDWRGNGGYVVAAGSIVNGVTYQIVRKVAIAEAPASLLNRIRSAKRRREIVRDESGRMLIPEGRRNATLASIAGAVRRFGVDYNSILELLRSVNTDHCEAALEDEELRDIAASIATYPPADTKDPATT